jgi:hypothetical protein
MDHYVSVVLHPFLLALDPWLLACLVILSCCWVGHLHCLHLTASFLQLSFYIVISRYSTPKIHTIVWSAQNVEAKKCVKKGGERVSLRAVTAKYLIKHEYELCQSEHRPVRATSYQGNTAASAESACGGGVGALAGKTGQGWQHAHARGSLIMLFALRARPPSLRQSCLY